MSSGSKRKATSALYHNALYVDEDFESEDPLPGQESLSAFGLKLIDSRRAFAERGSITLDSATVDCEVKDHEEHANPEIYHRKKRRKKNPHAITLADLNSVVNLDVLLGKSQDVEVFPQTTNEKLRKNQDVEIFPQTTNERFRENEVVEVFPEIFNEGSARQAEESEVPTVTLYQPNSSMNVSSWNPPKNIPIEEKSEGANFVPETASVKESSSEPIPATRIRPKGDNAQTLLKSRRLKKGFFNTQLPSRIPKRPRPEQFSKANKTPRPSALRQLQAINSKIEFIRPDVEDVSSQQRHLIVNRVESRSPVLVTEQIDNIFARNSDGSDLALNKHSQHFGRNVDPDLPRNPDSAVHLLSALPTGKRLAFLHHIFFFFNHNHLTLLVRINNGQFITHLEKWVSEAITNCDVLLLRSLLLLLEILPVTPSSHCKGLAKILKTETVSDSIISNLFSRVNEKWQFLEQTIRSHKAQKDKKCKPSISFCDETETLEYSIYLPPDTVRKTKNKAIKGAVKQILSDGKVKDPRSQTLCQNLTGDKLVSPRDPRLEISNRDLVFGHASVKSDDDMSSCQLLSLRQSLDAASPYKQSSVSFGGHGQTTRVTFGSESIAAGNQNSGIEQSDNMQSSSSSLSSRMSDIAALQSEIASCNGYTERTCSVEHPNDELNSQSLEHPSALVSANAKEVSTGSSAIRIDSSVDTHDFPTSDTDPKSITTSNELSAVKASSVTQKTVAVDITSNLNDLNLESLNAMFSLVPSIVKNFRSTLLSSQGSFLKPLSPNPFLSSQTSLKGSNKLGVLSKTEIAR